MTAKSSTEGWLRLVVIGLGVLLVLPILLMLLMMPMMGMMGWWWHDGMAGGFSPLWGVGMMVFWGLALLAIGYALYRAVAGGLRTKTPADPALEELRIAYARGDLTEAEFEERRENLRREE